MKIALLSDLHLSLHPLPQPKTEADVVVLAGDLGRPAAAIEWAGAFDVPTLFVAGNHEFYGSDLASVSAAVRALEREAWHWRGVRFLGCTLWSDHRLHATPEERELGRQHALAFVRDFSR